MDLSVSNDAEIQNGNQMSRQRCKKKVGVFGTYHPYVCLEDF